MQEEKARRTAIYRPTARKRMSRSKGNTALSMRCLTSVSAPNPKTGMVKIRAEMGGVALRQPPEIGIQAV